MRLHQLGGELREDGLETLTGEGVLNQGARLYCLPATIKGSV
jgi:hypothetical protein